MADYGNDLIANLSSKTNHQRVRKKKKSNFAQENKMTSFSDRTICQRSNYCLWQNVGEEKVCGRKANCLQREKTSSKERSKERKSVVEEEFQEKHCRQAKKKCKKKKRTWPEKRRKTR